MYERIEDQNYGNNTQKAKVHAYLQFTAYGVQTIKGHNCVVLVHGTARTPEKKNKANVRRKTNSDRPAMLAALAAEMSIVSPGEPEWLGTSKPAVG